MSETKKWMARMSFEVHYEAATADEAIEVAESVVAFTAVRPITTVAKAGPHICRAPEGPRNVDDKWEDES